MLHSPHNDHDDGDDEEDMMMEEDREPSFAERVYAQFGRRFQHLLDRSTIYIKSRWIILFLLITLYSVRVYFGQGWYIISYGLAIYALNLLIAFLSPQIDPETEGPVLPSSNKDEADEFRPFSRRLPEFKFWYSMTRATTLSILLTVTRATDIPVFWPILVMYFIVLFVLTMRRQIAHMIKHRYLPFSYGKQRYTGKDPLGVA